MAYCVVLVQVAHSAFYSCAMPTIPYWSNVCGPSSVHSCKLTATVVVYWKFSVLFLLGQGFLNFLRCVRLGIIAKNSVPSPPTKDCFFFRNHSVSKQLFSPTCSPKQHEDLIFF